MTAQLSEKLIYEGQQVGMCTTPLSDFFTFGGNHPNFAYNCTALWRGYVGTWELVSNRLYLIALTGTLEDGNAATLATVFPDHPNRVFAHWYSGTIRIPQGRLLNYVHMGYGSTYETDILLKLENGVVISKLVNINGVSDSTEAPEGYGIGGMTVFPAATKEEEKSS